MLQIPRYLLLSFLLLFAAELNASSPCDETHLTVTLKLKLTALLTAANGLSTADLNLYSPATIQDLMTLAQVKTESELKMKSVQERIFAEIRSRLGDREFETALGEQMVPIAKNALKLNREKKNDKMDMLRGWGTLLLPENDPIFSDPAYLLSLMRLRGQTGTSYVIRDYVSATALFHIAWSKLSPTTKPVAYAVSGSDANAMAAHLANQFPNLNGRQGRIVSFAGHYLGAKGIMPSVVEKGPWYPTTRRLNQILPSEKENLEKEEQNALTWLEKEIARTDRDPVGAIILEAAPSNIGLGLPRTEFLLKVQAICKQHSIIIVADEIMTGGGRTGKFFAYEHHEGFKPDFVTFGKGFQVAGLAKVKDGKGSFADGSTNGAPLELLLKSSQILKRIYEDNLIENAAQMGQYFQKKLAERDNDRSVVLGLLIKKVHLQHLEQTMDRLLPYLSITRDEIDALFDQK